MGGQDAVVWQRIRRDADHRAEILPPAHDHAPQPGMVVPVRRLGRNRLALALAVAAVSDAAAWLVDFVPPAQWALDLGTALLLFLILGRRWAILPGLVAEAIPGLGIFPFWILVVLSIIVYDDIRGRRPITHS